MNKLFVLTATLIAACIILSSFFEIGHSDDSSQIPYPSGFRKWTHIKTNLTGLNKVPQAKYDGYHHIYANTLAMEGYRSGKFPDGSVLVFDKHTVDTTHAQINAGNRKFIDVMMKNSKQFKDTGGWGFDEFMGDSDVEGRISAVQQANCFVCHQYQKQNDFVFTQYKE